MNTEVTRRDVLKAGIVFPFLGMIPKGTSVSAAFEALAIHPFTGDPKIRKQIEETFDSAFCGLPVNPKKRLEAINDLVVFMDYQMNKVRLDAADENSLIDSLPPHMKELLSPLSDQNIENRVESTIDWVLYKIGCLRFVPEAIEFLTEAA